ncbi:hypothetical protein SGUI_2182 [Serinicoccus hydrothermalis]|uniref:Uncharacterized protein n=1 Tax=Serinicoccus hydrothermalis TaxID=1758689 RepID=A0A1B1NDQ4_9MICO|nr:hypothetical protein SGUI_2182 [Serinicoccus hydrothermalis]
MHWRPARRTSTSTALGDSSPSCSRSMRPIAVKVRASSSDSCMMHTSYHR